MNNWFLLFNSHEPPSQVRILGISKIAFLLISKKNCWHVHLQKTETGWIKPFLEWVRWGYLPPFRSLHCVFRARKINEYLAASSSIRHFDRPSKGDVRASAKQMRLVRSTQREGPWERERGDFPPSLRPLRALLSFEKKRDVWEQGRVHGARFFRPDWTHISLLLVACFWTRMKSVNRQEILKKKTSSLLDLALA